MSCLGLVSRLPRCLYVQRRGPSILQSESPEENPLDPYTTEWIWPSHLAVPLPLPNYPICPSALQNSVDSPTKNVYPTLNPHRLKPLSKWCALFLIFFKILASRFDNPGGTGLYISCASASQPTHRDFHIQCHCRPFPCPRTCTYTLKNTDTANLPDPLSPGRK